MDGDSAAPGAVAGTTTDTDPPELEALRFGWGDAYDIEHTAEHGWRALRRDGLGDWITAGDSDELWAKIQADYDLKHVPRDLPAPGEQP